MPHNLSPAVRGAAWMLASAIAFTAMTSMIKYLGADYPAALQTFYRQSAALLILLPFALRNPRLALATTRPKTMFFRSAIGTTAMILAFYAYQELPLATANALSFTRTLFIVPLAALLLGERLGPMRISATIVGFAGVLIILQPGSSTAGFGWPEGAALASSFLFALTVMSVKAMTRDNNQLVILMWAAILGVIFSLPPALYVWRWPSLHDLLLLALMGALGVINQACYVRGMAIGDAAALAPIDYTRLLFAIMVGAILFGEAPGGATLVGAALIIATTALVGWHEQRPAKGQRPATADRE